MKELTFSQFNRELNRMYKECNEFYHALAKHFGLSDLSLIHIFYRQQVFHGTALLTDSGAPAL